MGYLLAGDIGGTKTRLRLVEDNSTDPVYENTYSSQDYPDLGPVIAKFQQDAQKNLGKQVTIAKACLAIAGPVNQNRSSLTNVSWQLDGERLEGELGIAKVTLINDFTAIGYGILALQSEDLLTIQEAEVVAGAPIAVIGAGTGLGEAFLVSLDGKNYEVFSSEGGHVDFAPRSLPEFELQQYILQRNNLERLSVERVVSGQGIISIYQFWRNREPDSESTAMKETYHAWEADQEVDLAAAIAQASQNQDNLPQKTMEMFSEAYGAAAGNLALKILPYGGLYLAGGIAAKNVELLQQGGFMASFCNKGRMRSILTQIPIYIILNPQVGLMGAALKASQLH